jgi:poly-gamma-glutamate synthesis protein (capsule biosynthesis protein)
MKRIIQVVTLMMLVMTVSACTERFEGTGQDAFNGLPMIEKEKDVPDELFTKSVRIGAFGDMLIHSRVYNDAKVEGGYDFTPMVEGVMPYLDRYELLTANQETMIGGVRHGLSTYPQFNSPKEVGDALKNMGVDLVTLANNHTLDRGEAVIQSALAHWDQLEIPYVGSYKDEADEDKLRVIEKNGIRFAFLGYTYGTNGIPVPSGKEHLVSLIDEERMLRDVEAAREQADVVVMHLHFGQEYQRTPNDEQQRLAKRMIDHGVDIIFGHHPHVLQPAEWLEREDGTRGFVIYSLGNFLSGQDELYSQIGGIVNVTVEKTGDNIQLKKPEMLLTYVHFNQTVPRQYRVHPLADVTDELLSNHVAIEQELKQHYKEWMPEMTFVE